MPNLCHHLFDVGGGLEAEHTRFLANARRQCHSGWRFVQQGADHRQSFSKDTEMQTWKRAAGHPLSSGMEKRHQHRLCQEGQDSQLIKKGNFMSAHALDFLVCGAINEPRQPVDGSIPNQFFCVRCDQRALATGKHELCVNVQGSKLINHAHMKESDRLVTLAQEFWDTDQVLFALGLLPRDWLLASELAECSEVRMWESSGFKECASDNVLVASDGSRGIRETPKSVRQVAFGEATFSLQPQTDTSFKLQRTGFLETPSTKQTDGSKSRAVGSYPNPQPCRREVEHPDSDWCEIRDEGHHAQVWSGTRTQWRLVVDPVPADRRAQWGDRCHQSQVTPGRCGPINYHANQDRLPPHAC